MTTLVSQATSRARELVAELLYAHPMYLTLHSSEPYPADPLATIVRTSGSQAVRITWKREGTVLSNSLPVTFTGIDTASTIAWAAICGDISGSEILFTAELEDPEPASLGDGVVTIPIDAIKLIVA